MELGAYLINNGIDRARINALVESTSCHSFSLKKKEEDEKETERRRRRDMIYKYIFRRPVPYRSDAFPASQWKQIVADRAAKSD